LLSVPNKCLARSAACARVRRMVEPLQPRRGKILRSLARRARRGAAAERARGCGRRGGEELANRPPPPEEIGGGGYVAREGAGRR
jgi:hypothetical protein